MWCYDDLSGDFSASLPVTVSSTADVIHILMVVILFKLPIKSEVPIPDLLVTLAEDGKSLALGLIRQLTYQDLSGSLLLQISRLFSSSPNPPSTLRIVFLVHPNVKGAVLEKFSGSTKLVVLKCLVVRVVPF